jgi:hypothetical protein
MTKTALVKFLILFLFASSAYGQKVKYKDIWGLLSTKQYEAAEPFLKNYLKENSDNPNALLYMGIIFQEKSGKDDVLKQTRRAISDMDSAILYYDKAYKTITEKEVKRNDEYYQAYNRRDLRTGEFGVKLSDIQFDLEKKMEGLRERIDRVKMVKYYFNLADSLYKKTNALYRTLQASAPEEKAFYLRANENTVASLVALGGRYDSCRKAFNNYKSSAVTIGRTGYNQTLSEREIVDMKKDGASLANFYQDDLQVWDYRKFADKAKLSIEKEIIPMREHLVSYDIEINKLREKLSKDSISVRSDLTSLIDKLLMEQLKKYDPEPLPMEVFSLKISDLEYRSALLENKAVRDSSDLQFRLALLTKELKYVNRLDSMAARLFTEDIDKKAEDYELFIKNTYNSTVVLKSFVKALKEYSEREKLKKRAQFSQTKDALQWIVIDADSIPAVSTVANARFKPLIIQEEKFTSGLQYADSLNPTGYFYTIRPSRVPDVKVTFPVDKPNFKLSRLNSSKALTYSDPAGQIYFVLVYAERPGKDGKHAATLAKIYRSDGLAWSTNYQLGYVPKEIQFKPDGGELTIKGDTQQNTIDKNGKLVK